jgi:hypothetical protein
LTLAVALLTGCTAAVDGEVAKAPVDAHSDGAVLFPSDNPKKK